MGMDSRGAGDIEMRESGSERPTSVMRPGIRTGGRKRERVLVSDDSGESSLDSSDNDFEEQIRKLKVCFIWT